MINFFNKLNEKLAEFFGHFDDGKKCMASQK
jgi:hypothetical protein